MAPLKQPNKYPWHGIIIPWSAALRAGPSVTSKNLKDLPRGTSVKVRFNDNGWLYVEASLKGQVLKGYVSRELIAPLNSAAQQPVSSQPKHASSGFKGSSPAKLRFIPCSLPKLLLQDPGGSGGGKDFKHGDKPDLSWKNDAKVALSRLGSNSSLLMDMAKELAVLGGSEGARMVTHFASGSGTSLTHSSSSPIGKATESAPSFIEMCKATEKKLAGQLSTMAASGTIDCSTLVLSSSDVPWLSFEFSDSFMLKGIIGGTQGRNVWLNALSIDTATRKYTMQLRYVIFDDFGVDESDLYSPGLIAFWLLQHERKGYVPFMNIIDLAIDSSGTV